MKAVIYDRTQHKSETIKNITKVDITKNEVVIFTNNARMFFNLEFYDVYII